MGDAARAQGRPPGHPANIAEVREIRRRYPRLRLVIAHLGRCYTLAHAREALPQLADDPGLYFDSSAVMNADVHRFALQTLGPERILYGSDNPIFYMRGRRQYRGKTYVNRTSHPFYFNHQREPPEVEAKYTLYMYEELRALRQACQQLGLDRSAVEAIFHGNARRLIDMPLTMDTWCPPCVKTLEKEPNTGRGIIKSRAPDLSFGTWRISTAGDHVDRSVPVPLSSFILRVCCTCT